MRRYLIHNTHFQYFSMFGSGVWEKNLKIGVFSGCIPTSWTFFGFLELEVVFWDNINYIFNCINSDFKLKKNLKLQCGLTDINSPLHFFLPFSFFEEGFTKYIALRNNVLLNTMYFALTYNLAKSIQEEM